MRFIAVWLLVPSLLWGQQFSLSGKFAGSGKFLTSAGGQILFSDPFETGDFSKWDSHSARATVTGGSAHAGSYGVDIHYYGTAPVDANDYLYKTGFSTRHLFTRAYVKFIRNTEPASTYRQRKMIWWQNEKGGGAYDWTAFLVAWENANPAYVDLAMGANEGPSGDNFLHYNLAQLGYNTWYCIELEIQLNTPGAHVNDGYYRLWVNGVEANYGSYNNYAVAWTGTNTDPMQSFRLGEQLDCGPADSDENRYWDDVVVSIAYIGP